MEKVDNKDIIKIPYWALHQMVDDENPDAYAEIYASINKLGILYPLIVVNTTVGAWKMYKKHHNPDILDPPDAFTDTDSVLRIQGGNQRYRAGLDLGVKDFDCIVVNSTIEAEQLVTRQRKETKNRW